MPLSEPPRERTEIELPASILSAYAGEYEFAPGQTMTVLLEDSRLLLLLPGQQRLRLHAESETDFFLRLVDVQITFVRDAAGAVSGLDFTQGGRTMRARKTK